MRLPSSLPRAIALLCALWIAAAAAASAQASAAEGTVTYRCPGNEYKNTISAKEAEKAGCKKLEGNPITVIQGPKPRGGAVAATAGSGSTARVEPAAQRARDSDARRILEQELKSEEDRLAALKKDYNNGQPERTGDEKNYQRYIDRVGEMNAAIARKEADIAAIRREIQKLPPSLAQPVL
jgi:hypothetical protein